jgi:hypothetical protein
MIHAPLGWLGEITETGLWLEVHLEPSVDETAGLEGVL